ncbi:EGF and laminin G domain-containing protein-like [Acropora muricata]|uniref:EGF and laminin G domain-containing protein-like n=1 Tax=Acropora muricata TaxID=159855 RepID=UPI0034E484A5
MCNADIFLMLKSRCYLVLVKNPSLSAESESTCDSLKKNNPSLSLSDRKYALDFDDSGPLKTYRVFGNFSADPPTTRVESRDFKIKLTPSNQPISQRISYVPSLDAAKALARRSEWCYQYVDFGCKKAKLHTGINNEKLGFWVSSNGVYQSYWGGAKQGSRSYACGETNPNSWIDPTKKCNCDAGQDKWHSDEGYLNPTTLLPVVEDINGEVQDLSKLAGEAEFVKSGCGAACKNNSCKNHAKCLDNYNVYLCDCSKIPYYGYFCHKDVGASFNDPGSQLVYVYPSALDVFRFYVVVGFKLGEGKPCSGDIIRLDSSDNSQFYRLSLTNRKLQFDFKGTRGEGSITIDPPSVGDFCRDVHTFALSRRYKVVNYTIEGVKKPKVEIERLDRLFTSMKKVTIGKEGDGGFKGCITMVKVTREAVGQKPETVEPNKEYLYDGNRTDGVKDVSRATCGPEPKVPEIPTPRPVGHETDVSTPQGGTSYPKTKTVTILPSSSSASQLSVIDIIYIISIYFTVTASCLQYAG